MHSISNGSGPSLQVPVRVKMELLPDSWSRLWLHPHRQLRCSSMDITQRTSIGWVVSGSPSRWIYLLILGHCCYGLITVCYQNHIFNSEKLVFARFAVCYIDYFGICVFPLSCCIFAYQGGQLCCYMLEYLRNALIVKYARSESVDAPLTLILRTW